MTVNTIISFLSILPQFPLMGFFIGRFIRAERLWQVVLLFTVPVSLAYVLTGQWPAVQWLVTMALFLAFIFLTARIPRRYAVLHLIIGILLMFICSLIVSITVGLVNPEYTHWADMPLRAVVMLRLFTLPLLAMVWILNNRLCGRLFHLDADSELKRYTPFLVLECVILLAVDLVHIALKQTDTLSLLFILVVVIGFILLDLLLVNTVRKLDSVHDAELKQQQTLELLRDQASVYSSIQESSTAVRRLRHDMVNQLQGISYLLKNGDPARASEQLHAYLDAVSTTELQSFTGDPIADAVIRTKTPAMADAGIEFSCTGTLPENASAAPDMLCVLLSDLLDNAVRGCRSTKPTEARSISLRIGAHADRLVLRCESTCPPDDEIPETASTQDTDAVWNLDLLRRIAESNAGDAVFEHENGTFTAVIQFRMNAAKTAGEDTAL